MRKPAVIEGDGEVITCMACSGSTLVIASRSLQISIYNLETLEMQARFKSYHQTPILSMDLHRSSFLLATGSADSMVRVFDLRSKTSTHMFRTSSLISSLRFFDEAGNWCLIAGCEDGRLYVWDLMSKQVRLSYPAHSTVIRAISFDGWLMMTTGRDSVVCFWNMRNIVLNPTESSSKTQTVGPESSLAVFEEIEYAGFLKHDQDDVTLFYTAGNKGVLKVWHMQESACIRSYPSSSPAELPAIVHAVYDKLSNTILLVDVNQTMNVVSLDLRGNNGLQLLDTRVGTLDEVLDLRFVGKNGNWLAIGSTAENVMLMNLGLGSEEEGTSALNTGRMVMLPGHKAAILSVDGDYACGAGVDQELSFLLVSGSKDNSAKVWLLNSNDNDANSLSVRHFANCIGHVDAVTSVVLSHLPRLHGNTLQDILLNRFLITSSDDHTIKKWDISALLKAVKNTTTVEQVQTEWTVKAHEKDINAMHLSHNNKLIASSSQDRTVKIWNSSNGEEVGVLKGHKRGVWSVRFSPDDKYIATASGDKTIKLWNTADYSCLRTFEGHTNSVLKVEFIASTFTEGSKHQMMVSSGSDGLMKVWAIASSDCAQTIDNHEDKVWALAIRESVQKSENAMESDQDIANVNVEELTLHSRKVMQKCLIATGSGDSSIAISADITDETLAKLHVEAEQKLLQDQELKNLVMQKDYAQAMRVAMKLGRGFKVADILRQSLDDTALLKERNGLGFTFSERIDKLIQSMNVEYLEKLVSFIKDWNTQGKWAHIAQCSLNVVLHAFPPKELLKLPNIKPTLDALIPYTDRHLNRIDDLIISSHILDLVLDEMNTLQPMEMDAETEPVGH